jgi:hypothetical protein
MAATQSGLSVAERRSRLAELTQQFGLAFKGDLSTTIFDTAKRLGLVRKILTSAKPPIACAAKLLSGEAADPCLIVHSSLPVELLPKHKTLAVGGQVESIALSRFSLPAYVSEASFRSTGSFRGERMPVLAPIRGDYRFLVRANSFFFECDKFCGEDVDGNSAPVEPDEDALAAGRYHWGNSMADRMTLVVAEY